MIRISNHLGRIMACVIVIGLMIMLTGCQREKEEKIIIAEQYGLAYAPLQIMREKGFLETQFEQDIQIEWVKLANTAAIREAMLSQQLDIGFMGIPPFLIGVDQKMPWKIMSGLSQGPVSLITDQASIKTLSDLVGAGKIALPQPGSIQHILLAMEAENILGDSKIFDQQLVSMKHPDGLAALLSDTEVVAHYTAPPYSFEGLAVEGIFELTNGNLAMGGEYTFIVGVCQDSFFERKDAYAAFMKALEMSMSFIDEEREETLRLLSDLYEIDEALLEKYLYDGSIKFKQSILGVDKFADFMYRAGYTTHELRESQVIWE